MHASLIQFNRVSTTQMPPDLGEKVGSFGLGLLRIGFGKTVEVTYDSEKSAVGFRASNYSLLTRISAIIGSILILPVTALLAGIGCIGLACSNSHADVHAKYFEWLKNRKASPVEPPAVPPKTDGEDISLKGKPVQNPFSRKFARADGFDLNGVFGKPSVLSVLGHLQKDKVVDEIIKKWHVIETQKPDQKDLSLVDLMAKFLRGGTCYGQAMNILELLGLKNVKEISEEYLATNMTWQHYVYFQIVHILHVFLLNCSSAYVQGLSVKEAREKIEPLFPHHNKKGHSSSKMKLTDLDKEILVGNFSDFIKMHVRGNDSNDSKHDYAVQISLKGTSSGHAAIIYYSETEQRYFWYDPYLPDYGLFSTDDHRVFFRGVAEKLIEYQIRPDFTHLQFTAYKL